uniref:C2H2-type domain-containing protein n=1 Tax=Oryzias latipes TaxID=8090 RepID=A0A3B3IEL7_ORYLA
MDGQRGPTAVSYPDANHAMMDEPSAAESGQDRATCKPPVCGLGLPDPDNNRSPSAEDPAPVEECSLTCEDCGLSFTQLHTYNTHLHQHSLEEEEAPLGERRSPGAGVGDEDADVGTLVEATAEMAGKTANRGYFCHTCGKAYKYLVSFRKHLSIHKSKPQKDKNQSEQHLRKYECPDCGMSFIRRTRLISHLKVHRARKIVTIPKCDQCNKDFTSAKSWLSHLQMHKERRFWCLSCAQGYTDEVSLDKHLQRHSLNSFKKKMDSKVQRSGKMVYKCEACGEGFPHSKAFLSHQKKHVQTNFGILTQEEEGDSGTNAELLGDEDSEMNADVGELPRGEEDTTAGKSPNLSVNAEAEKSDESDCGEPVHCFKLAKLLSWTELAAEKAPDDPSTLREHKYCEWECILCDSGFDEVAKLHLHYTKHATGEIPIPQE